VSSRTPPQRSIGLFAPAESEDPTRQDNLAGEVSPEDPAREQAAAAGAVAGYVDLALPLPLPDALTYAVPAGCDALAVPGARARAPVGKRRLVGVIVARRPAPPPGVAVRQLEAVLDREPVLGEDLLDLARFTASYYLAPLGEVLRSMLPADLAPWGDRRVRLTNQGALSLPRAGDAGVCEAAIIEALREGGRIAVSDLQVKVGLPGFEAALAALEQSGRIAGEDGSTRSTRYVPAVALAPEVAPEAVGRSAPAREVVQYLAAVGRPATSAEVTAAVGCGAGVLRRLIARGVLRQFTQVERLSLDRHRLAPLAAAGPLEPLDPPAQGVHPALPVVAASPWQLRADQGAAVAELVAAIEQRRFLPVLLQGMTGSGKTEVYLRAAAAAIERGRSAILLVPEIALVPALAREVLARFGDRLAILHSGLGAGERNQEWERVRQGGPMVVLGPRSALFAPVADLGLLVVDEEQDSAYKQEVTPRYQARDLALVRGRAAAAATLLVSATPSLESRHNVALGKLGLLRLTARFGHGALPTGILVDLRQEEVAHRRPGEVQFSARLRAEIAATLEAGEQAILLRNRRGYSPMLLCRACGEAMRCPDCGLPRTYHRSLRRLLCHYCGQAVNAPQVCPVCGESALEPIGAGTERVEEDFQALFPGVPVDVLDRDSTRRPGGIAAVLARFERGGSRVLIGTQMVSKGHHFPNVALTAVLTADSYLSFPDFRAVERTYNLLTQVAGRAGRGDRPGRVVIQTFHPEHYAIQAALSGDDDAFLAEEMRFRRVFHYPPFTRMAQLLVHDRNRDRAHAAIEDLAAALAQHPASRALRLTGPAPAPFERLRGEWRYQLLVRGAWSDVHRLLSEALPKAPAYDLTVDIDPQQLL
jgi:primosomal protein N' (replication factor Y) (superfamily II helicase)